jgi:hypothetical protein
MPETRRGENVTSTDPREDESRAVRSHGNQSVNGGTVTLGLIPAPEIPEKIARELAAELPDLLDRRVDVRLSWDVSVFVDPLTGSERDAPEILDVCRDRREQEGWDMAVCMTDLPVYRNGHLVVADVSASRGVAGLSLPALGALRLRARTREVILRVVEELYARLPGLGNDDRTPDGEADAGTSGRRKSEFLVPFRSIEPPDEDMKSLDVDVRFAAPKVNGHPRLLAGMVLANRPWKLFPSFKGALAAAFATSAFALISPTVWALSDLAGWARHVLLMVLAIVTMVAWIIVSHRLWERPQDEEYRRWTRLYNTVTVLTVTVAMLLSYATLFVLVLVTAWIFVPGNYFQSTLKHPADFGEYLSLAWLGASLALVAGAMGSSLEHEETVREAAYGYRQRRRNEDADEDGSDEDGSDAS